MLHSVVYVMICGVNVKGEVYVRNSEKYCVTIFYDKKIMIFLSRSIVVNVTIDCGNIILGAHHMHYFGGKCTVADS